MIKKQKIFLKFNFTFILNFDIPYTSFFFVKNYPSLVVFFMYVNLVGCSQVQRKIFHMSNSSTNTAPILACIAEQIFQAYCNQSLYAADPNNKILVAQQHLETITTKTKHETKLSN